jgi:hydrogenase-4 component B
MNFAPGLLVVAAALPALLAAATARRRWRGAVAAAGPWTALPALAVSVAVQPGAEVKLRWLLLESVFGVDSSGRVFLFFTALLWMLSGIFAQGYLSTDKRRHEFFFFYLLAMSGNLGVILAGDLITFYLFFALMSFSSYGLVIFNRSAEALHAGTVYIALVILGELLLFSGLVVLASQAGGLELREASRYSGNSLVLAVLLLGFGIKAGVLPLHVWLPLAHPVAPTPASAVLSGAMIKAGLIGWFRFLPLGHTAAPDWGAAGMLAGLAAAFYGVLVGVTQENPKTVLAYSSISQMGLMTVGIGAGLAAPEVWPAAAGAVALYALHHGLAKGTLFLGVGVPHSARYAGARIFRRAGLVMAAASLAGAPWTSGALAKIALKSSLDGLPAPWPAALGFLLTLAAVGTTLLMVRFLFLAWPGDSSAETKLAMWIPWGLLVAATASAAWMWVEAPEWVAGTLDLAATAAALWPAAAGGVLAWVAWRVAGGELPASLRVPAGDLLGVALWLWRPCRNLLSARAGERIRHQAQMIWPAERTAFAARRSAAAGLLFAEGRLRDWTVAGAAVLLLFFVLLACLARF